MAHDGLHVVECPLREGVDDGDEAVSRLREFIFDADGDFGEDGALQQSVGFECVQGGGEHFGRDVGDELPQLVEPRAAVFVEDEYDEQGPFVAEACDDIADGAHLDDGIFFFFFCHSNRLFFTKSEF